MKWYIKTYTNKYGPHKNCINRNIYGMKGYYKVIYKISLEFCTKMNNKYQQRTL